MALGELNEFAGLVKFVKDNPAFGTLGEEDRIERGAQIVEQILDRVVPGWRAQLMADRSKWALHRAATLRAIAQLSRGEELREKLGENAPQLDAARLHPWVWEGAKSLWQSGHYREAVRAASVKVNAETQNKVNRRDISETELFNQVLSVDPPKPDSPRLRLPGDDGGKTATSVRRGLRAFAEGCYAAIRNPASHDDMDDLPDHEALEQLAAFSILARWIDAADVVTDP